MISEVRPACQVDPAWQVDLRVEAALRAKSTLRAESTLRVKLTLRAKLALRLKLTRVARQRRLEPLARGLQNLRKTKTLGFCTMMQVVSRDWLLREGGGPVPLGHWRHIHSV